MVATAAALVLLSAACSAAPDDGLVANAAALGATAGDGGSVGGSGIVATPVSAAAEIPATPPAPGTFRMHVIDVGTGLSVLMQGADFTLLYDAGTNDESAHVPATGTASGNQNRLLAYLYAAVGPSGGPECVPQGDHWTYSPSQGMRTIDHVVLSHAHEDHISMMRDVLHCYAVKNVWEPGANYPSADYQKFSTMVRALPGVAYHTATAPSAAHGFTWTKFAENDVTELGAGALFKVLHADGALYPGDINKNSTVLRFTLGTHSVLLTGDAEGGDRDVPMSTASDIEGALLASHAPELAVDVLQVGHHGSDTSSRSAFVDAVFPGLAPRFALLSAGPHPYSGVVLPDAQIVSEYAGLADRGVTLFQTDIHDASGCPTKDRVGMDNASPAGCDNYLLTFR